MINAEDFTIDYFDFTITIIYFLKNTFSAIFYIDNFEYSKKYCCHAFIIKNSI